MKRSYLMGLVGCALLLQAGSAPAAQPASTQVELQMKQQEVARAAAGTKGGARQQFEMEEGRINGLIRDLESGRDVDPASIDRVLKRGDRNR